MDLYDKRPNPDLILESLQESEFKKRGKLKIFFGYAAGVGKTYAMLDDAQELNKCGVNVLVGYVEPHTRPETMQLLHGLKVLPPKAIMYRNIELKEFDLDQVLSLNPDLVLVDELAHSNAEGVRNRKRYQDIEELLNAGIDVYTTVNVQHIESLNNVVQDITRINIAETVPDYIFDEADWIQLIDIEPDELLQRFREGKIYRMDRAQTAMQNFFTRENLRLLREIAMRKATDRISSDNQSEKLLSEKMANTKLLVCMSESPASAKCIRWTARAADAFKAPWAAIYVENGDSNYLSDEQQKKLRANLDLAKVLGAETVILNGYDLAEVISAYAKMTGITNVVIGKSSKKYTIRGLLEIDLEDRLIAMLPNLEVHIIPSSRDFSRHKPRYGTMWLKSFKFTWSDTFKSVALLVGATILSAFLQRFNIGDQNIIMAYILSVLIISRVTAGYVYGAISSVASVLTFNYFFTEPYFTFNAYGAGYPITFAIMFLVAIIMSTMTVRTKTQAKLAVEREQRTEILYEISKKLLATRGLDQIIELINDYLTKLIERSVIFYAEDPINKKCGVLCQSNVDVDSEYLLSLDEQAVAHWVFVNHKHAGSGTDTLMGAGGYYSPVVSQGKVLGVIGIGCAKGALSHNHLFLIRMLSSQVAMALERQHLSDEQRMMVVETEKEKMRSNLLRAISHDLRTPLTGILGASSAMLDNANAIGQNAQKQLLGNIKEDSQWLIRMVENLLSVTKINEEGMTVCKVPEAAEEVITEAVARTRQRFEQCKLSVDVPKELLFVPMDGTLIIQVLINLIENAIKYSKVEDSIEIQLLHEHNWAIFEVRDSGVGISSEMFPHLFDAYAFSTGSSSDSSRGLGIGLSICNSIIKAHDGTLEAENRETGGAVFRFKLPLK